MVGIAVFISLVVSLFIVELVVFNYLSRRKLLEFFC